MDVGVQRSGELKEWLEKDPIKRLRDLVGARGVPAEDLDAVDAAVAEEVDTAVQMARAAPYPEVSEVATYVFAGKAP